MFSYTKQSSWPMNGPGKHDRIVRRLIHQYFTQMTSVWGILSMDACICIVV